MDEMESIKQTFFQECEDLLRELESGLLLLKDGQGNPDSIDSVFRAVHSIKGGAGAFNLTDLVSFSHTFENVLDDLRSAKRLKPFLPKMAQALIIQVKTKTLDLSLLASPSILVFLLNRRL